MKVALEASGHMQNPDFHLAVQPLAYWTPECPRQRVNKDSSICQNSLLPWSHASCPVGTSSGMPARRGRWASATLEVAAASNRTTSEQWWKNWRRSVMERLVQVP